MSLSFFLFFLLVGVLVSLPAPAQAHGLGKEKVTHLHFYLHDVISGDKPTAVQIAQPNVTLGVQSATPFGTVFAINDPITSLPVINPTTIVGDAQGIYVSTGLEKLGLVMMVDFGFTHGKFNGSSFSVMSRNPVMEGTGREVAVVGGRGKFRFGRGSARLTTYYLNPANGDAIIEFNVTILHY